MKRRMGLGLGLAAATALVLIAGVLAASPAGAQSEFIHVSSATLNFNAEASIDLDALGIGPPGLGAWDIGIVYDPDVASADACTSNAGSQCNANFASNRVQVVGASGSGHQGDTTLATITFSCVGAGTTTLAVVVDAFADATEGAPQPLSYGIVNGQITCSEPSGVPPSPRPRPRPTDEGDQVVSDDSGGGITGLPKTGGGAGGAGGTPTWVMIALASVGLASVTGFGALRLSAHRSSEETRRS